MDNLLACILVGVGSAIFGVMLGQVITDANWRYDCNTMNMHRHWDVVYECKAVSK